MESEQFRWIGKSLPRVEDERLMRRTGRYIDDLEPIPGCKVAAIVRSPYAHAHIRHIDVEAALQVPGVVGAITGANVRQEMRPFSVGVPAPIEYYPMAIDKVRFVGEPVAVVVDDSRYIAEVAAELVHVEYDPLPAVMGVEAALQAESAVLHENVGSNVANHRIFSYGEWERPLKDAPYSISARFEFPKTNATPIETYGVIANYAPGTDEYTVWANFHGPFTLHTVMAQALKIGTQQLRLCVPADIGGSYGIKSAVYPYITLIALASKLVGCPVRWIEDRMEHLKASSSGTDRVSYMTGALDENGHVLALKLTQYDDVGAYIRAPEPATLYRTHGDTTGAYDIPALYMDNYAIMTNRLPTGLIRGYGGPQLYFALERFMDIAAHRLGLDPVEIRRRNFIRPDQFPFCTLTGGLYDSGNYEAVLDIEPRSIRVIAEMDTATSPWSVASGSYSSRFAPAGSSAVYTAAMRVRSKLLHLAAEQLQVPEAALRLQTGRVYHGDKDTGLSIRRLAGLTHWSPTELPSGIEPGVYETSYYSIPTVTPPNEKDQVNSSATYGFLVDVVKVQIDPETAEIKVLDYITVHDAGRLLNPKLAHGQILGGLAHGLGNALFEEMVYDEEGQLLNGSFMDYLCPTVGEMPAVEIAHQETPSPLTPLGAKALGEGNTMSAGAAIANAVADALGVEPSALPLSPTRVWDLLCQRNVPPGQPKREESHETIRI